MKKQELALKVVVDSFKEYLTEHYEDWGIESWQDMIQAFGWTDSKDVKDEIFYILNQYSNENNVDLLFDDDSELELENGEMLSYRKFLNMVKKDLFDKD